MLETLPNTFGLVHGIMSRVVPDQSSLPSLRSPLVALCYNYVVRREKDSKEGRSDIQHKVEGS